MGGLLESERNGPAAERNTMNKETLMVDRRECSKSQNEELIDILCKAEFRYLAVRRAFEREMIPPDILEAAVELVKELDAFSAEELATLKPRIIGQTSEKAIPFIRAFIDATIEQKKITAPGGNPETVNGENDSTHISPTE